MTSQSWLTQRFQKLVKALMPNLKAGLEEKPEPHRLDLATAENHLIRKELIHVYKTTLIDRLNSDSLSYPSSLGGDRYLLKACADFFNQYFQPRVPVLPDHIVIGPGLTACASALLCTICKPGDVVFVPGSYWNGFDFHLSLLPDVQIVNIKPKDPNEDELGPALVRALNIAASSEDLKGNSPRALVLTNPHNPTGRCYPLDTLRDISKFCQDRDIHLIVDEIYALSRCQQPAANQPDFTSIMSLDILSLGVDLARVHILWGLSKDFGSSGIRMGCVISQNNPEVRTAIGMITTTQISSLTCLATTGLLTSPDLPRLVLLNAARLSQAYVRVATWLTAHDVEFVPATHGVYVLARFGPHAKTCDDENDVVRRLRDAGVLVAAGRRFHLRDMGWVRMTIAVNPDVLTQALARIVTELKLRRKGVRPRVKRGGSVQQDELEGSVSKDYGVDSMSWKERTMETNWHERLAKKRKLDHSTEKCDERVLRKRQCRKTGSN